MIGSLSTVSAVIDARRKDIVFLFCCKLRNGGIAGGSDAGNFLVEVNRAGAVDLRPPTELLLGEYCTELILDEASGWPEGVVGSAKQQSEAEELSWVFFCITLFMLRRRGKQAIIQ